MTIGNPQEKTTDASPPCVDGYRWCKTSFLSPKPFQSAQSDFAFIEMMRQLCFSNVATLFGCHFQRPFAFRVFLLSSISNNNNKYNEKNNSGENN